MKRFCYIFLIFSSLCACPALGQGNGSKSESTAENCSFAFIEDYFKGYYSQVFGISQEAIFNFSLYQTIENWLGTPYRYAGKSVEGIDCSSFVNRIYDQVYCFLLSGNSAEMAKQVTKVSKCDLKEGDLVFFKINHRSISHVGVYLGNDKFAHASRSQGVIISDLNHPYYKKYFVKGGRVGFNVN